MGKTYWEELKRLIARDNSLIMLGEKHGAEVNPRIIDKFVKELKIDDIFIELNSRYEKTVDLLKYGQFEKFSKELGLSQWILPSGLLGMSHLKIFQKFLRADIKIHPVKVESENWNTAEIKTSKKIEIILKKDKTRLGLLVMGNLHARKKSFRLEKKLYKPVGFLLAENIISVQIRYAAGAIYNFRKIGLKDAGAARMVAQGEIGLIPSKSIYFDYDYIVTKTNPLKLLNG
ncbi:MAG: hypothetical protein COU10_01605 [Candidatus Harrisonbacteria bacterium CG10_big_fil_rev_8_21_14_0_10_45_28]|uniref:Haem-binding uptake Tiki superfamily ChaN domain-containing protein n=1 Tax=Candidatus Harrisonbacteria bacterium CG10_big_fil_rev_8_21_14_0_10_45_28 TaxID=1974586 RepID=A0A2H0UQC2_9BACT|nr:MAG: hypothetical protein COU10_01605 [Candidatus Harrisonbacteria bacterium CG10_big_fil_rev_8_21_14_0_10_45_28]